MRPSILLLDDDAALRELLGAILEARRYEVFAAGTAKAATEILEREQPDLVVVDGLLPDVPGIEWIENLRKHDTKTQIVFLSAFWRDLSTFHRLTGQLGVSMVLYKPMEPDAFANKIAEVLPPPRSVSSLPPPPGASPADAETETAVTDLRSRMEALRKEYVAALPKKLEDLASLLISADQVPANLTEAISCAHRLRGTAGAYGLGFVGVSAGHIEDLLIEYQSHEGPARRSLWPQVIQALSDARLAAAQPGAFVRDAARPPEIENAGAVLLVDDDPDFRKLAAVLVRKQMLEVCVAQSSAEALHKARQVPLRAAIIDVHLGEEDAFDLARSLRNHPEHENLPIALVSVDHEVETRVMGTQVGASLFLEKPITEESFALALQQLLDEANAQRSRVLLLEDDPDFSKKACLLLESEGVEAMAIDNPSALSETLEEYRPDLLVLDINLPKTNGLEICRALRMSVAWQTLPIFMVTSRTDHESRIKAFEAGATDFVSKPIIQQEFTARVGTHLRQARLLQDRSERDSLSGLLLRRPFLEALERRLSESHRYDRPIAIALMDIDHFKRVNDTHGHGTGDAVIAALGQLLRRRFRSEDLRCRWGGEEFMLAFPGQDSALARSALNRVLKEFAEMGIHSPDGERFSVTFSAGVAAYPDDGASAQALIRRADKRLYRAKEGGRNQVIGPGPGEEPVEPVTGKIAIP